MSLFGRIGEFSPTSEKFSDYIERLEFYLQANDVEDGAKKRSVLLTVIGASQFRLLKDLVSPASLTDKTFEQLCGLLKAHHEPAPPKFLQRATFEARTRQPSESCQQYIAELRKLAEHCQFGEHLEERLCERFSRGINNEHIQRKLLGKEDLTLHEAVNIAVTTMTTVEAAKSLQSESLMYTTKKGSYPQAPRSQGASSATNGPRRQGQPPRPSGYNKSNHRPCGRCGGPHSANACKFKTQQCHYCKKTGHIAKVCRSKHSSSTANHNFVQDDEQELALFSFKNASDAFNVELLINKHPMRFQIDTGASLSVINQKDFRKFINTTLSSSSKSLSTYTGEKVTVVGEAVLTVQHEEQELQLPILVIEGEGPPLIGRDWLKKLRLNWGKIFKLTEMPNKLKATLSSQAEVFGTDPGLLKDCEVSINIKEGSIPKFCKARHPPYSLRAGIEEELERLEKDDIIEKVNFSDWATPIVPVLKKDKSVRICGDYKTTINKVIEPDQHPIPLIDELASKLAGGEKFSQLDFSNAYTQLKLDAESRKLTTINTHKGLYRYKRLCFGFSSCPSIFQRIMDSIFQAIPGCVVYFDNLYITGPDDESHLKTLNDVLQICKDKGLRIRRDKCEFMQKEVTFLGYRLNCHGLQPQPEKLRAINDAPRPSNVNELRAYLGLVNYYGKFISNLSTLLAPLYDLLRKETKWHWGPDQQRSFKMSKSALSSDKLLVHFNPNKKLVLTCDASPYGVGAILSHCDEWGERPIAYASRSLNSAERNYAQIDREGLALIFGVKKFHKYIFGRPVDIYTDHKPLLGLFGEHKAIPDHASARVQHWAMILSAYNYRLAYRPGNQNNADALSRLPLPESPPNTSLTDAVDLLFDFIDNTPVSADDIARETQEDPVLKQVFDYVSRGWPAKPADNIRAYTARKSEISIDNGCLLWGTRVIIPTTLRPQVLDMLHDNHIGISRMKAQARAWVWWPLLDYEIERTTKTCVTCELNQKTPKAPLNPWDWPQQPWSRVHMDFAGPFLGKMFLIIVDAHSKWIDVKVMTKITASDTILELREVFSTLGLPQTIVTDNGPTWTSEEFQKFMAHNGVKHVTSSPYHPASNGLAERAVQTFKQAMVHNKCGSVRERVYRFLTKYRTTPHTTTGLSPAELIFGRTVRTHFDLLHHSLQESVNKHQLAQKHNHDKHSRERDMCVGENVFVRNYGVRGEKWVKGCIVNRTGPVSYQVMTDSHGLLRRHQDQIRTTACELDVDTVQTEIDSNSAEKEKEDEAGVAAESVAESAGASAPPPQPLITNTNTVIGQAGERSDGTPAPQNLRRSGRIIKPPERLDL